jgi:predicted dehydrogenase
MRFLVAGCGSIGKRHISNLLAVRAGQVVAFDVRSDRAEEVHGRFGIDVFTDLERAFSHRPDAVFVTAPTSFHLPLASRAASARCHLFIEKPLSHTTDGIGPLLEMVRQRGLITLVGCNLRFHPGLREVKRLLDEGAVGRVVAVRAEVGQYLPDWHPEEDYRRGYSARRDLGGGVILDAIHEIDYIRWLVGPVRSVACFAGTLSRLEIETEDTAAVLLRFSGGALGEVHLDYVQRIYSRSCQVIGDEGTIRWDYSAGETRVYRSASREWETSSNPPGWRPNQMYVDELDHFLRCLAGAERPTLDVFDAARVLDIALAAKASSESVRVIHFGVDV